MNRYIRIVSLIAGTFMIIKGLGMLHESLPYIFSGMVFLVLWAFKVCEQAFIEAKAEIAAKKESDHA